VGIVQSEEYSQFGECLSGIAFGMEEVGLVSGLKLDASETDARAIWDALSLCNSDSYEFVDDFFYTMKDMDESEHPDFINRSDIDLVFVLGTVAGVYFAENEESTDFMVFASTDPVRAGIVKSVTERVRTNSYAYVDPDRMGRQIEVLWQLFNFNKIGVVYDDSTEAYAYSGIGQLKNRAMEHGFDIVELHVSESAGEVDDERYYRELKAAYATLIEQDIDALYITVATTAPDKLPWLMEDISEAGIVTLSQPGDEQLDYGVILGVTQSDFPDEGRHIGRLLAQYAGGTPVGELEQLYEIVPKITLNYSALRKAGLSIPFRTLLTIDEIKTEVIGN
jgi:ABC-type uncharacterized transport system substrate-binding protein